MSWILDLLFFLVLLLGTAYGAFRGFVEGVMKLAKKFFLFVFAFTFCVSFSNFLELCFGMTTAIASGLEGAISGNEVYAVGIAADTVGAEIGTALEGYDMSGIARWFISISFKSVALIPAGTTPAMLISAVLAKWITIVISFVALILLVKLGSMLVSLLFNAVKDRIAPIRIADQALGAALGLAEALVVLFILFLLLNWLPIDGLHNFISSSAVVGKIFSSEWFQSATSYAVSGAWFNEYLSGLWA